MNTKALPFYQTAFVLLVIVQLFLIFSTNEICVHIGLIVQLSYLLVPLMSILLKRRMRLAQLIFKIYLIVCGLFMILSGSYLLATHIGITDYFMLGLAIKGLLMGLGVLVIFKYRELTMLYTHYFQKTAKSRLTGPNP
ncbi:hypothetical protein [Sphingobacterium sp. SYP-B4668]|uniref:hypothetical protein n=1 Tax=Sphingobacterium sp. SYP-B4668 TaxID=2996035 RepID=UPI0022DD2DA5|nr:hypothetical protein [Sphingobacterium sp. SYP-B4668]